MKKIKRILICAVLITVCFLLETTVFQKLAFASIIPNLLIIVTSSFGFMRGQKEGMIIGFFCGLLKDILGGNLLGFYALIYMLIGYGNGFFQYRPNVPKNRGHDAIRTRNCGQMAPFLPR